MAKRRGQAALEFLSTYGFAFLIILVMIGALSYFGILSPGKFIPGSCLISPEFKCDDYQLVRTANDDANVSLLVINQVGNQLNLNLGNGNSSANSTYGNGFCVGPAGSTSVQLVGGGTTTITCAMTGTFPAVGETVRVGIDFKYTELGGAFTHPVRAEVVSRLQ